MKFAKAVPENGPPTHMMHTKDYADYGNCFPLVPYQLHLSETRLTRRVFMHMIAEIYAKLAF